MRYQIVLIGVKKFSVIADGDYNQLFSDFILLLKRTLGDEYIKQMLILKQLVEKEIGGQKQIG